MGFQHWQTTCMVWHIGIAAPQGRMLETLQVHSAYGAGQVTEKHTEKATIESKGKPITRKGEPDNPAFKVERKGKNPVIKKACTCPSLPCSTLMAPPVACTRRSW